MLEKNFTTIVFGATSLIGKSIIRSNPKKIVYISRKKIKKRNIKWFKFSINKKSKITKKRIKVGIFLIRVLFQFFQSVGPILIIFSRSLHLWWLFKHDHSIQSDLCNIIPPTQATKHLLIYCC